MCLTLGAEVIKAVNNDFYHDLGDTWWTAQDHMITFLREESHIKVDYILRQIKEHPLPVKHIVDLGCGAGFVAIPLAKMGYQVTAVDISESTLDVLRQKAMAEGIMDNITCIVGDITQPIQTLLKNGPYDAVFAMDVLEHVVQPELIVEQVAHLLKPQGLFLYHTLNKTLLCWLLYLQIAPRLIRYSPKDLHLFARNIKPEWMNAWLEKNKFQTIPQVGIHAPLFQKANFELLTQRKIVSPMRFEYCNTRQFGYLGGGVLKGE